MQRSYLLSCSLVDLLSLIKHHRYFHKDSSSQSFVNPIALGSTLGYDFNNNLNSETKVLSGFIEFNQ